MCSDWATVMDVIIIIVSRELSAKSQRLEQAKMVGSFNYEGIKDTCHNSGSTPLTG